MSLGYVSWFSGIGGFDLALDRAGFRRVGACEIDPHARSVFAARLGAPAFFPEDIDAVEAKDVPAADLWCGGFPCQDLSVAGKRAGINAGERSGLIWRLLDLFDAHPEVRWLLLENVPGLLSGRDAAPDDAGDADDGAARDPARWDVDVPAGDLAWMGVLLGALADRGLRYAWRVLDAQFFGVPQRRKRVFILAGRAGAGADPGAVLLEPDGVRGRAPARGAARARAAAGASRGARGGCGERHVAGTIGAHASGGYDPTDLERCGHVVAAPLTRGSSSSGVNPPRRRLEDDVNLVVGPVTRDGIAKGPRGTECVDSKHLVAFNRGQVTHPANRSRLAPGDPAPTLSSTDVAHVAFIDAYATRGSCSSNQHPVSESGLSDALDTTGPGAVFPTLRGFGHGWQGQHHDDASKAGMVRRLTPLECERLQGFPDGWTCLCGVAPYSTAACRCADGPRYRALGNAVAVPVVEWIARRLAAAVA